MFFPREEEAPELAPGRVKGLRLSLNTPVVTTQELPAGPARAAILVHQERDGRPNITVGLRSLRSGERVLYSFEGDLREHSSLAVGIDAALSFGESMGFLFDDDEFETAEAGTEDAVHRALGLWAELMGESPPERAPAAESAARPERTGASPEAETELLLEEVAEAVPEPSRPAPGSSRTGPPSSEPGARAPAGSARALSKFRGAGGPARARGTRREVPGEPEASGEGRPGDAGSAEAGRRATALGRLKLVKRRRRGGGEAAERPGWMLRLLGSF